MVEHFLPGRVKLAAVLLQQPLLGQGDGLLGRPQDLHRPLELLSGLLGFDLGLERRERGVVIIRAKVATSVLLGNAAYISFQLVNIRAVSMTFSNRVTRVVDVAAVELRVSWTHSMVAA